MASVGSAAATLSSNRAGRDALQNRPPITSHPGVGARALGPHIRLGTVVSSPSTITMSVTVMHWPPSAVSCSAMTLDAPDTLAGSRSSTRLRSRRRRERLVCRLGRLLLFLAVEHLHQLLAEIGMSPAWPVTRPRLELPRAQARSRRSSREQIRTSTAVPFSLTNPRIAEGSAPARLPEREVQFAPERRQATLPRPRSAS